MKVIHFPYGAHCMKTMKWREAESECRRHGMENLGRYETWEYKNVDMQAMRDGDATNELISKIVKSIRSWSYKIINQTTKKYKVLYNQRNID